MRLPKLICAIQTCLTVLPLLSQHYHTRQLRTLTNNPATKPELSGPAELELGKPSVFLELPVCQAPDIHICTDSLCLVPVRNLGFSCMAPSRKGFQRCTLMCVAVVVEEDSGLVPSPALRW
mmetsp:Transcript_93043/g.212890  ORF Transcript_93043/g.212890 Transcript_93043/m.212890 type:complete len:121 (-) Transcript_93043:95-457(-)